jgi:glycerophosphoryl diester phosphodiesterase
LKIVAHRGARLVEPENTLPAFKAALELGANAIEFDAQMSSDGQLVVFHDYSLERTSNGEGRLYEKPVSYLRTLDVGGWFSPTRYGERMPLLAEVLEEFRGKCQFELELKGFTLEYIQAVGKMVADLDLWRDVEITGAPGFLISKFKECFPEARVGTFISAPEPWMSEQLYQRMVCELLTLGRVDVAHISVSHLRPDFMLSLKQRGILVHAANCSCNRTLTIAHELGVDQLSTDDLELAGRTLAQISSQQSIS